MRNGVWWLVVVVSLVGATQQASAQPEGPRIGGHIKGFLFHGIHPPARFDRTGARLQLALSGGDGAPASYVASVDFELDSRLLQGDQALQRGSGFDIFPVEMFVTLSQGPVDITVGKQFIFWGRTAWINPTDVLSPWDFGNMASEVEDYRVAPLGVRANWYLVDELMLDLVWLPIFSPDRIPLQVPQEVGGLQVFDGGPGRPDHAFKNGELAARISHTFSNIALDWAICGYKGFEKLPTLWMEPQLDTTAMPPALTAMIWHERYDPIWMVGADVRKSIGSFVLVAEGAAKFSEDKKGDDPLIRNSRIELVAGVTYGYSEDLSLSLQYQGEQLLDYDRGRERAALTQQMGGDPGFVAAALSHEGLLRIDLAFTDELGAQLIAVASYTDRDLFALGFLHWQIADSLEAYLGAVGFAGEDENSPYGRMKEASRLFVELKQSF